MVCRRRHALIDRKWLLTKIEQLVPESELKRGQSQVWSSFLAYNGPYRDYIELFEPQYFAAIDAKDLDEDEQDSLAHHVAVFYLRGNINLNHRIIDKILHFTHSLRGVFFQKIGRALEESDEQVSQEVIDRVIELFKVIADLYDEEIVSDSEAVYLSRWLNSLQLPVKPFLKILDWLLAHNLVFENIDQVISKLSEVYEKAPLETLSSALSLCRLVADDMQFFYSKEDLTSIIQRNAGTRDEATQKARELLRNFLSSRGLHIESESTRQVTVAAN